MLFLTGVTSAREALTSALGTVASDMTGAVTDMVPIAAGVLGAVLVITIGYKAFKRFSK